MDTLELLQELRATTLSDRTIAAYASLSNKRKRRGRRKMSAEQKQAVSASMKKYWASRRKVKAEKTP